MPSNEPYKFPTKEKGIKKTVDALKWQRLEDLFPTKRPLIFKDKIESGVSSLARQFVPQLEELFVTKNELKDPIGDEDHSPVKGLIHRYKDRVLLNLTYQCAVHCRFCFRKSKVSQSQFNPNSEEIHRALNYIQDHKEIKEVIFSGGDPFYTSNALLKDTLENINAIQSVRRIRFHTRIPTVLPKRFNSELLNILEQSKQKVWVVAHINSPLEFTPESDRAIEALRKRGVQVLMQTVLLKGVNDRIELLKELLEKAIENQVLPYYLHYPDLVEGTSHFRV
ncbi:MAG: KamA family radical SAM protein, partial [Bdellovibrionales bacterium]|nr:KamA family radical SAM protein [Bdellovibrionales bacterium]